jgi:hypothetical protein
MTFLLEIIRIGGSAPRGMQAKIAFAGLDISDETRAAETNREMPAKEPSVFIATNPR